MILRDAPGIPAQIALRFRFVHRANWRKAEERSEMRLFGRLESGFWNNPKVVTLTDHQKLLLIYLYSCKHGNSIGCYVMYKEYVAADLGWSVEAASSCLSALIEKKFIVRDDRTNLIKVRGWWGHNVLGNLNHAKNAAKCALSLPACSLKDETIAELRELADVINPKAAKALRDGLLMSSQFHPVGIAITETETDTEIETETDVGAEAPCDDAKAYAFSGRHYLQGITEEQVSDWLEVFTTLNRMDLLSELSMCDQHYAYNAKPPNRLQAAGSWLKREHQSRLKEKRKERETEDEFWVGAL